MKAPVVLLALVLSLLSACHSPTAPEATLAGRVTNKFNGAGYYPASVALLDGTEKFRYEYVNTNGEYRFRDVKPGSYTIVLTLGQGAGVREVLREPFEVTAGANVKNFEV